MLLAPEWDSPYVSIAWISEHSYKDCDNSTGILKGFPEDCTTTKPFVKKKFPGSSQLFQIGIEAREIKPDQDTVYAS